MIKITYYVYILCTGAIVKSQNLQFENAVLVHKNSGPNHHRGQVRFLARRNSFSVGCHFCQHRHRRDIIIDQNESEINTIGPS